MRTHLLHHARATWCILRRGGRPLSNGFLLLAILASLLLGGPVPVAAQPAIAEPATVQSAIVQPELLHWAAAQPATAVRVIVQKQGFQKEGWASVEQYVRQLGGEVLSDLYIIHAFAAELPAGAVPALARHAGVRWISLDAPVVSTGSAGIEFADAASNGDGHGKGAKQPDPNQYLNTLRYYDLANQVQLTGQGIGVAVVDSGVSRNADFSNLIRVNSFNSNSKTPKDAYGHGTHVAGIIAGNGANSKGLYRGIAPGVQLISVKISDETGMAYESDSLEAMQWIYANRDRYNIRVVNLSINTAAESSYHTSPLDAGVEFLWFNGIVVVASAGNKASAGIASATIAPPANDPYIITVGATNELGTGTRDDDMLAPYTAYGHTRDGFLKPDIVAPGSQIYSVLSRNSRWDDFYPDRTVVGGEYFRLSGTSMAAPMVTGAVALLLQAEPDLTPNQVKYRLTHTGSPLPVLYDGVHQFDVPYLDLYGSVMTTTNEAANSDLMPSFLMLSVLQNAIDWSTLQWDGTAWDGVDWSQVEWDGVNWSSVNWNSVNWNSVNWNSVNWNSVNWNSVNWNSVNWNSVNWNSVNWNSVNWNSAVLEDELIGAGADAAMWLAPAWPPAGSVDWAAEPDDPDDTVDLGDTIDTIDTVGGQGVTPYRLYAPLVSR